MAGPTLTTGGRSYAPPPIPNPNDPVRLVAEWRATLTRMLERAIRYGELDRLAKKRQAWVEANPWHERHDERHALMWATRQERNELGGQIADDCGALSRMQGRLPPAAIDELEALVGHLLFPYVSQRWAVTAARLQTARIDRIAFHVLADLRAEDEVGELIGLTEPERRRLRPVNAEPVPF